MTRKELIQAVALCMDEITPGTALSSITVDGSDNNPLYQLIDGLIDGGVLELFSVAPYWRLPQTQFTYNAQEASSEILVEHIDASDTDSRQVIRLKVKGDFLRVAEISCKYFQRPITEVVPEQSAEGKRQHNRFLLGKEAKPVGVMSHGVWNSLPCREIDCYSIAADTTVTPGSDIVASYIAKPATIHDDTVTPANAVSVEKALGDSAVLIPALQWLIAARTFGARGDVNHASICQQNAQNLLV